MKVARPRALASALEKSARRAAAGAAPLQPVAVSSTPPIAAHPPSPETHAAVVEDLALQPGFLSLDSAPWSEVFLGASALGTTPLIRVPLPPGRHQLTLRNSELGASTTYVVEIKSGQSLARLVGWGR